MQTRFYDNKLKAVVARLVGGQRRIFLVTAMLMALVLVGTVAASVNFVLKWGSPGSGDGEFAAGGGPGGVAVDASGNVYVVDGFNHRIQKFDSNGNFITKWGGFGFGDGQLYYPYAVAVDASGNIFVADAFNYRIQKFDSNGNFLGKWGSQGSGDGEFNFPASVAVDTSGNVYVADLFNTRIQKFDSNGTFLAKWGSQGVADGQFNQALGVAADASGNVYVADAVNQNVQKFDSDGNFITRWGSLGSGIGEFAAPSGLAVDASSNVYVVDVNNNRIQKFDSNGNFIDTWGSLGAGDGEFNRPYPVAVDSSFNVYVGELINERIQKFNQLLPNQAPVVTITAPASGAIFAVGTPVNFSGTFADNAGDTHTAQWKFDNLAQAGTVNEINGTVTATHVFATAGVYQVKLTVTDQLGASGTADTVGGLSAMIVIYDPSGGWVTGGGWINSPAGAYAANPSLTGKASFGFVSKYEHGAHVPTGQTEFQFKAGNLNFHSTSYDWLVVAGARAQYKGSGTINGAGDYAFMLTAIDGQINGGGGQDKFRIKIWSKDNGGVIYDNQMGGGDADNPTTALGGGSIVIHN
ncbi:MAG TPA: 6-bladed beta-propeller [Blastocatellia bacterium]|nr:6-bladed beta-propeller [Blastocatellia bacterium]